MKNVVFRIPDINSWRTAEDVYKHLGDPVKIEAKSRYERLNELIIDASAEAKSRYEKLDLHPPRYFVSVPDSYKFWDVCVTIENPCIAIMYVYLAFIGESS
jgi:hypothetical protein